MKAEISPLILENFSIAKNECTFIPPKDTTQRTVQLYDTSINVDFEVKINEAKSTFHVFMNLIVNEEKKEGYYIYTDCFAAFNFDPSTTLSDADKQSLIFSGVNMCITSLRGFITNVTSYMLADKYVLPMINTAALLKAKQEEKREPNNNHTEK